MVSGGAILLLWVLGGLIGALIGAWIAGQKDRDGWEGALLGFFLGPVGWVIEALLPAGSTVPNGVNGEPRGPRAWESPQPQLVGTLPRSSTASPAADVPVPVGDGRATKRCPRCAEDVKVEAVVCRFCGHEFAGAADSTAVPAPATASASGSDAQPGSAAITWPPGDWITQPDWSPTGFHEVEVAVDRLRLPGLLGGMIRPGARLHVTPREDGSWVESDRGAGALVGPSHGGVIWATARQDRQRLALTTLDGELLALLRFLG